MLTLYRPSIRMLRSAIFGAIPLFFLFSVILPASGGAQSLDLLIASLKAEIRKCERDMVRLKAEQANLQIDLRGARILAERFARRYAIEKNLSLDSKLDRSQIWLFATISKWGEQVRKLSREYNNRIPDIQLLTAIKRDLLKRLAYLERRKPTPPGYIVPVRKIEGEVADVKKTAGQAWLVVRQTRRALDILHAELAKTMAELSEKDKVIVDRDGRIQRYLSEPFHGADKTPRVSAPVENTQKVTIPTDGSPNNEFGYFIRFGLGPNLNGNGIDLIPFNQRVQRRNGIASMLELGANYPINENLRLRFGLRGLYGQTTNHRLINLFAPGTLQTGGKTRYFSVIPFVGLEIPIGTHWFAEATAGAGWSSQRFNLKVNGLSVASASGGRLAGQFSAGLHRIIGQCLSFGMVGYLTTMNGIRGQTSTGVPFRTGRLTDFAIMAVLAYRFGSALSSGSDKAGCS